MRGVRSHLPRPTKHAPGVDGGKRGKVAADDSASCADYAVQPVLRMLGGGSEPNTDGERQHTLYHTSVELCEDVFAQAKLLELPEEVQPLVCPRRSS